ncbi:MAG: ATP-binding protein [Coprococcus sp.]
MDLCLIFGNLLDNAVTACRHVRTDARFIRLSADLDTPGHLYITMVNSFDGNVCTRNGKYISTKERKSGIGLASIQATIQKYHGSSNFYTEQHEFISNIMLKLKENETE